MAHSSTYLFYDLETSGLNKCFDQILQFAAIRTDLNFNEIDRYEIKIKLNPDVIPAPGAIITHRISIQEMQIGETELQAIFKIHRWLNYPGTISLGYNTLGFDDEFLRFSFFRNLLTPYTHQYANNCKRMDIYPIAVLYYLFSHETLNWPTRNDKISLKLEDIAHANGFLHNQAHNAMSDVEATIQLAQKLAQNREIWNYMLGYFDKTTDQNRIQQLPYSLKIADHQFQEGLMIAGKFGADHQFQAPVVYLGPHYHYRNQTLWLRLDQEKLTQVNNDTIAQNTFVIRKRLAEQPTLLPPNERFMQHLNSERKILTDLNREFLQKNPELFAKIRSYHQDYKYPDVPQRDSQAGLYDTGFPAPQEEKLYQQFHQAKPSEKSEILQRFNDSCRHELGMRLLARYYPECLAPEHRDYYQKYLQQLFSEDKIPVDFRGNLQLTPQQALREIEDLVQKNILDAGQLNLLNQLSEYLNQLTDPAFT